MKESQTVAQHVTESDFNKFKDEILKKIKGDGLSEKDVNDLIKNHPSVKNTRGSGVKQGGMYAKDKKELTASITSDVMRNIADNERAREKTPSPRPSAPPASHHVSQQSGTSS